jgi:hypothetical protein
MINVAESFVFDPVESAVIENLIIDGKNMPGVTGILLQNVAHCMIRNLTIRNCEVGIHVRSYKGLWSECTNLKHIRMENVKKGIVFTTTGPYVWQIPNSNDTSLQAGASAAFTTIDDVDIGLKDNDSNAVGIQVGGTQIISNDPGGIHDSLTTTIENEFGDPIAGTNPQKYSTIIYPYSSHIRARVRLGNAGGTGLRIMNGMLYWAQAHLTVTKKGSSGGIGVDIQNHPVLLDEYGSAVKQDRVVWENQFSTFTGTGNNEVATKGGFMLVVDSNIATPVNPVLYTPNNANSIKADIQIKTISP